MATATKEKVTFISDSPNLRVLLKARRERILQDGAGNVVARPLIENEDLPEQEWIRQINAEAVRNGEEPPIDVATLPTGVDFKSWHFDSDDENVITALRLHPSNGSAHPASFHEQFATAEERLAEVADLTASGDTNGLRDLLELEARQGNHASVLQAGQRALAALDTAAEPEGKASGETAEAGSTADSQEPPGESGDGS